MLPRLVIATLLASAPTHAHGTICHAHNDQSTSVSTALTTPPPPGLNPNAHAYRFVPVRNIFPHSAWIFTGSPLRTDFMRLELWTDTAGMPGVRIASGAMASPQSPTARWLGANFESVLQLSINTPYWFVWVEAGDSILAEEPSGTPLTKFTRSGGGAWTSAGSGAAKFRIFCGDTIEATNVMRAGSPCASSLDQVPYAWTNEQPTIGNPGFAIEGVHLPLNAPSWLMIGFNPGFVPIPLELALGAPFGCTLYTATTVVLSGTTGTAEIGAAPANPRPGAAGHVRFSLPIPNNPGLTNFFFAVQIATLDSGAAAAVPLVFTNALHITVP